MEKKELLFGAIGLLIGILATLLFTANVVNSHNAQLMRVMGIHVDQSHNQHMMPDGTMMSNHSGMTMDDMVNRLKGKSGEEFEKIFLSDMIVHHEGAVDMAELTKKFAIHDELKKLAENIIS